MYSKFPQPLKRVAIMCYISQLAQRPPTHYQKYIKGWFIIWTGSPDSDNSPTHLIILQAWQVRNLSSSFDQIDFKTLWFRNKAYLKPKICTGMGATVIDLSPPRMWFRPFPDSEEWDYKIASWKKRARKICSIVNNSAVMNCDDCDELWWIVKPDCDEMGYAGALCVREGLEL